MDIKEKHGRHPVSLLTAATVERLRTDLAAAEGDTLPPLRALACRYGVSWPVMSRALGILAQEGLIDRTPRRRARLIRPGTAIGSPLKPAGAEERLAARFRLEIEAGVLAVGDSLPKAGYVARDKHVSNHTVGLAYARLVAEGIVHRRGKHFVVGRAPHRPGEVKVASAPVILVLCVRRATWEGVCSARRTEQFGVAFLRERDRLGARLIHVPATAGGAGTRECTASLRRILLETGGRYVGTILPDIRPDLPDLVEWARLLGRYDRPVVWFDRRDQGLGVEGRPGRYFFRCHHSEDGAAAAALTFLADMGHRRICCTYQDSVDWQVHRRDRLAAMAATVRPGIELFTSAQIGHGDWQEPETGKLDNAFRCLEQIDHPRLRQALAFFSSRHRHYRQTLARWIPEGARESPYAGAFAMTLALRHDPSVCLPAEREMLGVIWSGLGFRHAFLYRCTAAIGPNDSLARGHHLEWLKDLRLAPADLSVLSFDNAYRTLLFHLTSVDMGLGTLGYLAFHALAGDVPVPADRRGDIAARPYVVDNGSVLPPPGRLKWRVLPPV